MFPYYNIGRVLELIPNSEPYKQILADHIARFYEERGSQYNHQAWEGGYVAHVQEVMNIAIWLYYTSPRRLPFELHEALEVLFLHDIEKVFASDLKRHTWECCECDYRDSAGKVVRHLMDAHGYPQEDAGLGPIEIDLYSKPERKKFRENFLKEYGIELTPAQKNAMQYVEGVPQDEYSAFNRVMNELAAFCHMCDIASARLWHDKGKKETWDE